MTELAESVVKPEGALAATPVFGGPARSRWRYLIALALVIAAGLASRRYGSSLPGFIAAYAGDTLWATMVMMGIVLVWPRIGTLRAAAWALGISYAVEIAQLYHAPWIDAIRSTTPGGLALGHGFLWSDIACYTVGVLLGIALDRMMGRASS